MNQAAKFNVKACSDYISTKVEEFHIDFRGGSYALDETSRGILIMGDRAFTSYILKKFLIEAEENSTKSKHEFLNWLSKRRKFWQAEQYTSISKINKRIENSKGKELVELQLKRDQFMKFFHYNYDLIEMIEKDVMNGYEPIVEEEDDEGNKMYWVKNGKEVMPLFKFLDQTGFNEEMKRKFGVIMNPTHNFELLKSTRLELFEQSKSDFEKERQFNELKTTEFEINLFYLAWLRNELVVIENWSTSEKKKLQSTSDQIELLKYKLFVETEIEKFTEIVNKPINQPRVKKGELKEVEEVNTFSDIFVKSDWKKYISALEQTEPNLLNSEWEFIGKPRKHKGVICSWIKHLQNKGEIRQGITRAQLAKVLNSELKNFNIGLDGKTFDNVSSTFDDNFKETLIKLSN